MSNAIDRPESQGAVDRDVAWGAVWIGFGIALLGTLAAGTWAFAFAGKGTWWAANAGALCVFCGAVMTGYRARTAEPLNGALIAVFYFSIAALVIFSAEFLKVMPDPLPGLPRGDSTFYFVWPLELLAASTIGTMAGGWLWARRSQRGRGENLS